MNILENILSFNKIPMFWAIVIVVLVEFLFYYFIIKLIVNVYRRGKIHNYFKSNVINNETVSQDGKYIKKQKNIYNDISKDKLEIFNTDNLDLLKDYFYDIFLKFENAYNNLDYNEMKKLSTKQLFQNYYTGITLDLKIGQKKIINDIQRKNVIIYELDSTIAKQTLSAMIEISYLTYTINSKGDIISGSRDSIITERFEVTYRKDFDKKDITKCPNCGANITGNICDFCRTIINNAEFKISSIKKIIDN